MGKSFFTNSGPYPLRWNVNGVIISNDSSNNQPVIAYSLTVYRGESIYYNWDNGGLCKVKWDQNDPYNIKCPWDTVWGTNQRTLAGCTATALAQMFSAEKCRPSSYNGHIYNWNLMLKCPFTSDLENNPEALDELATLLVDLGNTENLNINYEYEKWFSGAYPDRLVPTLKNFGFYNPGKLTTYNVSQAKAEIERGYPVIMNGYPSTGGGHTWILHGVMECHTEMYACNSKGLIVDRWIETSYYFNVNWGWRGNSDGYYLSSGFNAINGPDLDIDAWPPSAYGSNFDGPRTIVIGVRKTNTEI